DLLVLGGEEDDRHVALLPNPAQELHPVHTRHLDVKNGKIRRARLESLERRGTVGIGHYPIAFGFERDRDRSEYVAVVVDQGNGRHGISSKSTGVASVTRT